MTAHSTLNSPVCDGGLCCVAEVKSVQISNEESDVHAETARRQRGRQYCCPTGSFFDNWLFGLELWLWLYPVILPH